MMTTIAIVARGACSSLGNEGSAAFFAGEIGAPATTRVAHDEELAAAGLARPFVARARIESTSKDRATTLLEHALSTCASELDVTLPNWRSLRVGAAIGTSSGGMRSFEDLFRDASPARRPLPHAATYIGPVIDALPVLGELSIAPISLVLAACASSTIAIGLARAWLLEDRCDVVLCGGFDAVSVFVAAGFESLRATCSERGPRPFRLDRDGLALGEGAAIVALTRSPQSKAHGYVTGFGASCDATHLTAPDPQGAGLASAAVAALTEAGAPTAIDLISAHGTATMQNDASETLAITTACTTTVATPTPPVFAFKGAIGHTLGAAGVLEVLAALDALDRMITPASAGGGGAVEAGISLFDRTEAQASSAAALNGGDKTALKLASAFGGANAALVVTRDAPATPAKSCSSANSHHVYASRAVAVTIADTDPTVLAARTGYGADRIARADDLVRLAIAAVAKLEVALGGGGGGGNGEGILRGAGIIVGHGLATIETNARFLARIVSAGAKRGEPRRFPYTSPNAAAGECAVAFGLTGPAFAVGGGPHGGIEALLVASSLVRTKVIDRVVVVAVDEAGEATARIAPGTMSGAVALAVGFEANAETKAKGQAVARLEECVVRFDVSADGAATAPPARPSHAHRALEPLVTGQPEEITAEVSNAAGFAKARFFWL
jgi:3-oxoacyl-[acyl-carrier-protein] synthase II